MTREIRRINDDSVKDIVTEDCKCSGYTMAAVAGCLLLCLGIVIYALICG